VRTHTKPSEIEIDHVVAPANSWHSNASSSDDDWGERYANDPSVLLSVEDDANQEKGDNKAPEAWKPPTRLRGATIRRALDNGSRPRMS
jgi:hypothetical protein